MADSISTVAQHSAASNPLTITRNFQSAVFRLRGALTAMKFAAEADHEQAGGPSLFWPDLIDALAILTPDAAVLDAVVDELRIPRLRDARDASHAIGC
jgi:SpoU rRNA methylase family enzyme